VKVQVNGVWREVTSCDVASLLKELDYGDSVVATAVNGVFVATGARSGASVSDGDRLEVLAPMQGG
jgi:sulfur carrier protein